MLAPLAWPALALLVACGQRPTEDVRVRLDGAYLVIENRSGAAIQHHVPTTPTAPGDTPTGLQGQRLESGRFVRWRIAPSQRGQAVEVQWWRPGKEGDATGGPRPGAVRRVVLMLDDPQPLPMDELAVRACVAAHRAQGTLRPQTERQCMDGAEHCMQSSDGGLCAPMFHGWRRLESEALARGGRSSP